MFILGFWFSFSSCLHEVLALSCGIDNSPASHVYVGVSTIETYPWLGVLYYPYNKQKFTTAVVLVTKQIVLAAANEIDRLPKHDFRARARVIIGHNCSGPRIGIRDYTYHPDYSKDTYSTLAIVQLNTDHVKTELRPICPPPTHFRVDDTFFAMILSNNCKRSRMRIHKMNYVSPEQCKTFYRRSGLDVDSLWPTHTACANSTTGGHCVWRSGAILVVKLGKRWRLLGFGVYGPGCQAPARFLDYGMYNEWVRRSVQRIGRPAITTLAENHIILRRSHSNVQRFGPCDSEEVENLLFHDEMNFTRPSQPAVLTHNVTIIADVEYSCVVFKAEFNDSSGGRAEVPKLRVRRWCAGGTGLCYGFGHTEMHFYVEITFQVPIYLSITAYGRDARFIDPTLVYTYLNNHQERPVILPYSKVKALITPYLNDPSYPSFGKHTFANRTIDKILWAGTPAYESFRIYMIVSSSYFFY